MDKVLITGISGFIGYHLAKLLLQYNYQIVGLDNINDYYDVNLKYKRLEELGFQKKDIQPNTLLEGDSKVSFIQLDLQEKDGVFSLFKEFQFSYVINLAAQAGVRYSLENPQAYIDSNITGFLNVLEACRKYPVKHLIYASSSSVYGLSKQIPFSVDNSTDHPVAIYAASKKANEMMAHSYSHLFNIPSTGLRFFTVYGPYGRPDMALYLFTDAILNNRPFDVYNHGNMQRDFTYVDDIVESIRRLIPLAPSKNNPLFNPEKPRTSISSAPYQLFNIGNNNPIKLMDFVEAIEKELGMTGKKNFMDIQPGDVEATYANVENLFDYINFKPQTTIKQGIKSFIDYYMKYHNTLLSSENE